METEVSNELYKRLKQVLLIAKEPENSPKSQKNILAMLGLTTGDFPGEIHLSWDPEDILIQTVDFSKTCTCAPMVLKTILVDGERHTRACDLSKRQFVLGNPWLVDVERDDETITWMFQWPREIEASRDMLKEAFGELHDDVLWGNFINTWKGFTVLMDAPSESYAERMQSDLEQEAAMDAEAEAVVLPKESGGYDDGLDEAPAPEKPLLAFETTAEMDSAITVIHGAGNPAAEAAVQAVLDGPKKRGPGRPPKKKPEVATIPRDPDGELNSILKVSLMNLTAILGNAMTELEMGADNPDSWTIFSKCLKEARDIADAADVLFHQPGSVSTIHEH